MQKTMLAVVIAGTLVAGCAAPTQAPTVTPTQLVVEPTAILAPPTEVPTVAPTDTPTSTPTHIPEPTSTPTPAHTPTPRPTATPTPRPDENQVVFGIPHEALRFNHCGNAVFISQDHDRAEGHVLSFWDKHPNLPKPPYAYRSRDQRRNMDICTNPGFPITFEQDEGVVRGVEIRDGDGIMGILITKGPGTGFILIYGHVHPDIDPSTPGNQLLQKGDRVHAGDIIAYTGMIYNPHPELGTPTNLGLIKEDEPDYYVHQEMMYIGPDGLPNILW